MNSWAQSHETATPSQLAFEHENFEYYRGIVQRTTLNIRTQGMLMVWRWATETMGKKEVQQGLDWGVLRRRALGGELEVVLIEESRGGETTDEQF